ncbi:MAG: hypothetical protein WC069_06070 [Candidatus Shapirobacteria bacterium]|jgi:hypothetical protein
MDSATNNSINNEGIQRFISNPESFILFRGESDENQGGIHFTTDAEWAKNFGNKILTGKLPADSKIKLITEKDFKEGYELGILSEKLLWDFIFNKGYDAIVGHDAMNSNKLDVIVNPKHLGLFKN